MQGAARTQQIKLQPAAGLRWFWPWKKAIITFLGCPLCEGYCSKCLTFKPFKSSNHLSVKYFFPYSLLLLVLLSRFSRVRLCATPTDGSPSGSSVPGILQARTLKWVAISFSNACMHAKLLQSCPTPYSLWDCKESDVTEHTHTNASAFEFPIVPLLPFQAITGQLVQQHSLICCQVVWLISKYWSYKLVVWLWISHFTSGHW